MRKVPILLLALLLAACATIQEKEAVLKSRVDSHESEVTERYGKPSRMVNDPDGWEQWYYTFRSSFTHYVSMTDARGMVIGSYPQTITTECSFGFVVGPSRIVRGVGVKTPGCSDERLAKNASEVPPSSLMRALTGKK